MIAAPPMQDRQRQRLASSLCLLLTRSLCRGRPLEILAAAIEGGVDLVQVREKPFGPDASEWIAAVLAVCRPRSVPVIVNDRLDLATSCGADGVHLGQEDLAAHPVGSLRQRGLLLGLSTHDAAEMRRAELEAPDYLGVGPCFPTATKGLARGLDPDRLAALLRLASVPAFAIGGIDESNLSALVALGVERIAVSAAILRSPAPEAAARVLSGLLARARRPAGDATRP
jgi:thiamine-phosphate pyrophosphorylase